jgi:hypothetical protein
LSEEVEVNVLKIEEDRILDVQDIFTARNLEILELFFLRLSSLLLSRDLTREAKSRQD